jgi:hypothetical protein
VHCCCNRLSEMPCQDEEADRNGRKYACSRLLQMSYTLFLGCCLFPFFRELLARWKSEKCVINLTSVDINCSRCVLGRML